MVYMLLNLLACWETEELPPPDGSGTETPPEPSPYANCTAMAEYDDFADGTINSRTFLYFDANGAVTRQEDEMRADGTINFIIEMTNDADGHAIEQRTDSNADGTPEVIEAWTYDADGNVLSWTQDENADGTFDSSTTYVYAGGFLQRRDQDENLDGTIDHATNVTWTHGATDIGVYESDEGLDGDIDFWAANEYDPAGPMLSQEVDYEVDGVTDLVYEYVYDADWVLQRLQYTYDGGGVAIVDAYDLFYDAPGRLVLQEYDIADDGFLDGIYTYTYNCPS